MTAVKAPRLENRRAKDFERELLERARAWIPSWGSEDEHDFGRALLKIAARLDSEVAERLDSCGDKMRRGFLDWLGMRGQAARPARMPVVFKMAAKAPRPVFAPAPLRMQVDVQNASVFFESETDLRVLPGLLKTVVATDDDKLFLQPPGLTEIEPAPATPEQWRLKSFAAPGSVTLQLDPDSGLDPGMIVEIENAQYRIVQAKNDLATIDPAVPPGAGFDKETVVKKVTTFAPFDGKSRDRQEHALYLGDLDLLNLEAAATIDVVSEGNGSIAGVPGVTWQYWGKKGKEADVDWQPLKPKALDANTVRLTKDEGALEPRPFGSVKSARWIRAKRGAFETEADPLQVESLALKINATDPKNQPDPDAPIPPVETLPRLDAIVNTSVSPTYDFYPLGREPRLFDTLYLGCPEAFSKGGAQARVQFDLGETRFKAIAAFRMPTAHVLAGVDHAGALHLLEIDADGKLKRLAGHPPLRPRGGGVEGVRLTSADLRPVLWMEGDDLLVSVLSGDRVYQWREKPSQPDSKWEEQPLDIPPSAASPESAVTGLVGVKVGSARTLVAVRDGQLFWRDPGTGGFDTVDVRLGNVSVQVAGIAPAFEEVSREPSDALVCVVIKNTKRLLCRGLASGISGSRLDVEQLRSDDVDPDITPFALARADGTLEVVALSAAHDEILGWRSPGTKIEARAELPSELEPTTIDGRVENGALTVYFYARPVGSVAAPDLIAWTPFHLYPEYRSVVFGSRTEPGVGVPRGAVALVGDLALVPGREAGQVLAAKLTKERPKFSVESKRFATALAVRNPPPPLQSGDTVAALLASGDYEEVEIASNDVTAGTKEFADESFFWLETWIDRDAAREDVHAYPTSQKEHSATIKEKKAATTDLKLETSDAREGDLLRIDDADILHVSISSFDPQSRIATIPKKLSGSVGSKVPYWLPVTGQGQARVVPALDFPESGPSWPIDALKLGDLYFPGLKPVRQRVIAVQPAASPNEAQPGRVALANAWALGSGPDGVSTYSYVVDAGVAGWYAALVDNSSNPALTWEYWNGTGWWLLSYDEDTTNNLKNSGHVQFTVPSDLKPVDWAGKTSHWIRARLIGGDYGREIVVTTSKVSGDTTTQTSERKTEGIQPPYALAVWVIYEVSEAVVPAFALTQDSGTIRDQSDANRTPGAQVEAFVPFSVSLGRLVRDDGPTATKEKCPPECGCPGLPAASAPIVQGAGVQGSSPGVAPVKGRSLFLGFDAPLSGDTVNVLLMIAREFPGDAFAPLVVEALVGDRLTPLVAKDGTRAAGESGVITLSFPEEPTPAELFGNSLRWVRLSPHSTDAEGWKPSLRGAYLNGVWASATETLTRELLGSSVGEPGMNVKLARPPVLHGSLELRVKEALNEAERQALLAGNPKSVVSDDPTLPGDWVLWEKVDDPTDEDSGRRVYSLDEESGQIRFGDGLHGRIPPLGRDSIVAFRYQRTEPPAPGAVDVPANAVEARAKINLVTPVAGAEAAFAADHAAGGSPAEPAERVLSFGSATMRHRGRAVTARDLEDLALQSSPAIAQARAIVRGRKTRLVVVVAGDDPAPREAQKRELKRFLLSAMPPSFDKDSLEIRAPRLRRLRVGLRPRVETLDDAARVAEEVKARLQDFLDAAAGGRSKEGWPLGASPREEDIALALADVPRLLSLQQPGLFEIDDDGTQRPWPATLAPDELARLATDAVRFEFEATGTVA